MNKKRREIEELLDKKFWYRVNLFILSLCVGMNSAALASYIFFGSVPALLGVYATIDALILAIILGKKLLQRKIK